MRIRKQKLSWEPKPKKIPKNGNEKQRSKETLIWTKSTQSEIEGPIAERTCKDRDRRNRSRNHVRFSIGVFWIRFELYRKNYLFFMNKTLATSFFATPPPPLSLASIPVCNGCFGFGCILSTFRWERKTSDERERRKCVFSLLKMTHASLLALKMTNFVPGCCFGCPHQSPRHI